MKKIDLTKFLKPGDTVYSIISDSNIKIAEVHFDDRDFPIVEGTARGKAKSRAFNKSGSVLKDGIDSLIFPSKEVLTWSNFSPFTKGNIVLAYNDENTDKTIGIYSHVEEGLHFIFNMVTPEGVVEYLSFNQCEYYNL